MSTDDLDAGQPIRGKQGVQPEGSPEKKNVPPVTRDVEEEEQNDLPQRRSAPAIRLAAWIFALVLLLLIFGWALGGGQ